MTADELKSWRLGRGWTQPQCAKALGIGERSLIKYEHDDSPVPPYVDLACECLDYRAAIDASPWAQDLSEITLVRAVWTISRERAA